MSERTPYSSWRYCSLDDASDQDVINLSILLFIVGYAALNYAIYIGNPSLEYVGMLSIYCCNVAILKVMG